MRYVLKFIVSVILRIFLFPLRIFPVNNKLIVFDSYNGKTIGCNPYYIYEYLKYKYPDFSLIWVVKNKEVAKDKGVEFVLLNSFKYYYCLLTAKFYIRNTLMPAHVPFRKKQIRIDTWHGGGAYKGTMYAVNHKPFRKVTNALIARNTTLKLASCKRFIEYTHKDQLLEIDKFIKTGTPRCDIFFDKNRIVNNAKKFRDYYGIDNETFLILYAPTYRSIAHNPSFNLCIDFKGVAESVKKRFKKNKIILLFRGHHAFKKLVNIDKISALNQELHLIDTSDFQDTQAILCASDLLISDYSSIIWDFSLMYRPCFLFTPDFEDYLSEYEMCTPLEKTGFPLAKSNSELQNLILQFNQELYIDAMKRHHLDLGSYENGKATEQVCDYIINQIGKY